MKLPFGGMMKLIKGTRSLRRYVVEGDLPDGIVEWATRCFQENAFKRPLSHRDSDEKIGWTTAQSLLDTDFENVVNWHIKPYIYAMMRIDKKSLPSNLYKARLEAQIKEWYIANDREKIPKRDRDDIKDILTAEMMAQTLPKIKTVEFCWHIEKKYLIVLNTSDSVNDKFTSLFYKTFGISLRPFSPLMFLPKEDSRIDQLIKCGLSNFKIPPGGIHNEQ
jgi:DNA recombination-dependent growth factor C